MYTVGSLFAGIGGIDLAFTWAGYRIAWQVELDDYARSVLARHWPDVPRYRDVRGVTGRSGKGWRRYQRLEPVDVMVGGFPCQDISLAGRGAGILAGTRSGLWFEFARLIGELRPRLVLLENVAAITIRDGEVVIGSLAEMGYDARWGTIRASDAGAPHQRERWFCVAYSEHGRREGREPQQQRASAVMPPGGTASGNELVARLGRAPDGLPAGLDDAMWPAPPGPRFSHEPPRVASGTRNRAARLRTLGNAVVPDVVYPIAVAMREWLDKQTTG